MASSIITPTGDVVTPPPSIPRGIGLDEMNAHVINLVDERFKHLVNNLNVRSADQVTEDNKKRLLTYGGIGAASVAAGVVSTLVVQKIVRSRRASRAAATR
jgi:ribosomal protein L19